MRALARAEITADQRAEEPEKPWLERVKLFNETSEPLAKTITQVAVVAGAFSFLLGPLLLTAFSARVSRLWNAVPILNADTFSAAFLPLVCLSAAAFFLFSLLTFAFPGMIAREWFRGPLARHFPSMKLRVLTEDARRIRRRRGYRRLFRGIAPYVRDYIVLHAPTLVLVAAILVLPEAPATLVLCFFLLTLYGCYTYILVKDEQGQWRAISALVALSFVHAAYFVVATWFAVQVYDAFYQDDRTYGHLGIYIGVAIFLYTDFLLYIRRVRMPEAAAILSVMGAVFFFLAIGPSLMGAASLKALGVGGGIPASMLVKTYEAGAKDPMFTAVRGCVVMNLGGQMVIEEFRPASFSGADCLIRHWTSAKSRDDLLKTFCRISVYARSDIVRISSVDADHGGGAPSPAAEPKCDQPLAPASAPG